MSRTYPDEPAGGFPTPPRELTDAEGRSIRLRRLSDRGALAEMYAAFDPADRSQGLPPVRESARRRWLDRITGDTSVNVVARHDDRTVGHAVLATDDGREFELAVFVLGGYQGAGIGTGLLRTTFGAAAEAGIEHVWLSVERWNDAALSLYSKVGFERTGQGGIELEMTLRLDPR